MKIEKRLIIVRHAHRDTSHRLMDNGLTDLGRRQARAVLALYKSRFGAKRVLVLSSPKRRCVQTVEPLARHAGARVRIHLDLLEQGETESSATLRRRVARFCRWWKAEAPELTVICSHGDWIPLAHKALAGREIELKKGGWSEIKLEGGQPQLRWLIQSPIELKK